MITLAGFLPDFEKACDLFNSFLNQTKEENDVLAMDEIQQMYIHLFSTKFSGHQFLEQIKWKKATEGLQLNGKFASLTLGRKTFKPISQDNLVLII